MRNRKITRIGKLLEHILIMQVTFCIFSCNRSSNSLDAIKLECGYVAKNIEGDSKLVKILGPNAQSIDSNGLTAMAILKSGGEVSANISSRSCIEFKADYETLRIRTSFEGETVSTVIKSSGLHDKFQKINLSPAVKAQLDFICPSEGLYAKEIVNIPITVGTKNDVKNIGLQLLLRSVSGKQLTVISEKKIGDDFGDFGKALNIKDVDTGDYQIEIATMTLSLGLNENFALESTKSSCILHKLDAIPTLGNENSKKYIAIGDTVLVPNAKLETHYCKTLLKDVSDQNTCEMSGGCSALENFEISNDIVGDSSGVYRYFYFLKDRTGESTGVSCQDVSVSNSAPVVTIQWKNPAYSQPGSSIDLPYVHIPLKIDVSHRVQTKAELSKNLTCSAKFIIQNGLEIPANVLFCESKECAGRNLSKPVPCGEELILNMKLAYDSKELWDSILKVTVAAEDGSGFKSEDEVGLWMHSSRWDLINESKELRFKDDEARLKADMSLVEVGSDAVYLSPSIRDEVTDEKGVVVRFHGDQRSVYKSPDSIHNLPSFTSEILNDFLYILWSGSGSCILMKYKMGEEAGEALAPPPECIEFSIHGESDGYLWGISTKELGASKYYPFRFDGAKWEFFESVSENAPYCPNYLKMVIESKTDFSVVCEPLGVKIEYRNLIRKMPLKDFSSESNFEPFKDLIEDHCDKHGIFLRNGQLYFPMEQLVKKIDEANFEQFWLTRKCSDYARTGNSIYLRGPKSIYRFFISKKAVLTTVHQPLNALRFSSNPVVDSSGLHPYVISENGELNILNSFDYSRVRVPKDFAEDVLLSGRELNVFNRHSLLIVTSNQVWMTNPRNNWGEEWNDDTLTLIPEWRVFRHGECEDNGFLKEFFDDSRFAKRAIYSRVNLPCLLIQHTKVVDGTVQINFQSATVDSKVWSESWSLTYSCAQMPIFKVNEYSDSLEIICDLGAGENKRDFLDLNSRNIVPTEPKSLVNLEENWTSIFDAYIFLRPLPKEFD